MSVPQSRVSPFPANERNEVHAGALAAAALRPPQNTADTALYDVPAYYDLAFARDLGPEVDFYLDTFARFGPGPARRILEPGCGSGMFLAEFARRGLQACGYDLNPSMVAFTELRASAAGLRDKITVSLGDMRSFIQKPACDAAFNPINSLGCLTADEDLAAHFQAMARCLVPGGIYVAELSLACDDLAHEWRPDETWPAAAGDVSLVGTWRPWRYDHERKERHVHLRLEVVDAGAPVVVEEEHVLRLWFRADLERLASQAGFRLVAAFDQAFRPVDLDRRLTGEDGALYWVLANA